MILSEIRRCALANGGIPLGRGRFERETGIRETDWLGKYWARWGDAIREAGFEPNTLNASFAEDDLLAALVEFIQDLGHFPAKAELMLRRKADPSFPSHNVFARLGNRSELASRVLRHCGDEPSFEEVRGDLRADRRTCGAKSQAGRAS